MEKLKNLIDSIYVQRDYVDQNHAYYTVRFSFFKSLLIRIFNL